jgi:hypothetical protein
MKHFEVDVDITMSKRISVEAESEEHAKAIVNGWMKYNPYEYAHSFDAYVKHEITDVNEEEESEPDPKKPALDYVRSQIEEWRLEEYRVQINSAYEYHTTPTAYADFDRIRDLLEEYGQENDLPEGWWESEGDLDDWLYEL